MSNPWPLIAPMPGVSRVQLRDSLHQLWTDAYNIRGGTYGSGFEQLTRYLNWTSGAVKVLTSQIKSADIDRLILTRGYNRLLSLAAPSSAVGGHTVSVLNEMLNVEVSQRIDDLAAARDSLSDAINKWADMPTLVMPDTSVYIQHEDKLASLDFAELIPGEVFPLGRLIVLVPIVVIDELDRLKESRDESARWRATHTLGMIDGLFQRTDRPALIRDPEPHAWRGPVLMELVLDPPGHVRLPIEDDEIVDRALAMGAVTECAVKLITFDTGQALRARSAGLRVSKLKRPKDERLLEEPDPGPPSSRQARRQRKAVSEASAGGAQQGSEAKASQP